MRASWSRLSADPLYEQTVEVCVRSLQSACDRGVHFCATRETPCPSFSHVVVDRIAISAFPFASFFPFLMLILLFSQLCSSSLSVSLRRACAVYGLTVRRYGLTSVRFTRTTALRYGLTVYTVRPYMIACPGWGCCSAPQAQRSAHRRGVTKIRNTHAL